jgi:hypothetical protein
MLVVAFAISIFELQGLVTSGRKKMRWVVILVFGALLAIFLWIITGMFAYSKDNHGIEKDVFMKLCKPHPVLVCT